MDDKVQLRRFDNMVLLRNTPLFSGLAPSQLQRVVMLAKEMHFSDGDTILNSDQEMEFLYVVKEGKCIYQLDSFKPGDAVLEHTLFIPHFTLEAKLKALGETVLIALSQNDMYELLLNNPETTVRLLERFAAIVEKRRV